MLFKAYILKTYQRCQKLIKGESSIINQNKSFFESELDVLLDDDCISNTSLDESIMSDDLILDKIRKISLQARVSASDKSFNIFQYISENYKDDPVMVETLVSISAVPANQVTVERVFSGLKIVLSDSRPNLSADLINDILICRFNASLLKRIDFDSF